MVSKYKNIAYTYILLLTAFVSCNNLSKEERAKSIKYKYIDTLTFKLSNQLDIKKTNVTAKKYRILYSYSDNLTKTSTDINYNGGEVFKNITFDYDLCKNCVIQESHLYYPYTSNQYYCDTNTYNEVILFNTSYSFYTDITFYENNHLFSKRIEKLFPNLKYLHKEIKDYKDSIVDYVEFIVPYMEKNKILFTYNNFKNTIYKSDWFTLKAMYVKKGLERKEIWKTSQLFKNNNRYSRIIDSIP